MSQKISIPDRYPPSDVEWNEIATEFSEMDAAFQAVPLQEFNWVQIENLAVLRFK